MRNKINRTNKSRMKLLAFTGVALLIIGVLSYFLYQHFYNIPSSPAENPTSAQENEAKNIAVATKKQSIDSNSESSSKSGNESTTAQTPSITITYAYQNTTTFIIRTLINKVVASGSCSLKITQGAKQINMTSDIQPSPSSSSCKGFDVPLSELGLGKWRLEISFTSGELSSSTVKEVEVR